MSYSSRFCPADLCERKLNAYKSEKHEGKSQTIYVAENLDGYLPLHYTVPLFVWSAVIIASVVPTDFYPHRVPGTLDDVYWCAISGIYHEASESAQFKNIMPCYPDDLL